mgnify:CR=1 FL=1
MKKRDYDYIRKHFFFKYPEDKLAKEFLEFKGADCYSDNLTNHGKTTTHILNHFTHEVQYRAKHSSANYSPVEVLYNDELLDRAFAQVDSHPRFYSMRVTEEKRLAKLGITPENDPETYWSRINLSDINELHRFFSNASWVRKASQFSPIVARNLYESYAPYFGGVIHDSSRGWNARMLGALASNYDYKYLGTDPNTRLQETAVEMSNWIQDIAWQQRRDKVDLRCIGSEVFVPEWEGTADFSFTSPPYFDLEIYSDEDTQSIHVGGGDSYENWLTYFVYPTVENTYKYLKPGRFYCYNLKNLKTHNGKRYIFNDWLAVALECGFVLKKVRKMHHQSKRQFGKDKNGQFKVESGEINYNADLEPLAVLYKPLPEERVTTKTEDYFYKTWYNKPLMDKVRPEGFEVKIPKIYTEFLNEKFDSFNKQR